MPRLTFQLSFCVLLCASLSTATWAEEAPAPTATPPSAEQAQELERQPVAERSTAEANALEQQIEKPQQQQLQAADEQFLALWLPANAEEASGAVILLPGDDESADWPQSVGPLRRKLPDAGWHTLSLTLPSPPSTVPAAPPAPAAAPTTDKQATEENAENSTDTKEAAVTDVVATADSSVQLDEQRNVRAEHVLARIDAAISFAEQQKAKTVVLLGHGSGAYWAARYLSERKPATVKNLLLVAAKLPDGYSPTLEELIPELKLASGDFYYKDQPADRQSALKRAQASKRAKHPAYTQIALKALPGNPEVEQEQLSRRIRGWLSTKAQGRSE